MLGVTSPYFDIKSGANLSLYWGSSDGGTTASSWDNEVSIGKKKPKLNLWLDASDSSTITHSSNTVSQWNDKSGFAYHATSSTGPTTGSSTINGLNALTFGSGKKISSSTPTSANWQDVYIIARWEGGSNFGSHPGLFTGTTNAGNDIGIIGGWNNTDLYTTNWFDNIYLNTAVASNSGVLNKMTTPFLISGFS